MEQLFTWLINVGLIEGRLSYYTQEADEAAIQHALRTALRSLETAPDPTAKAAFYQRLQQAGGLLPTDNLNYYISGQADEGALANLVTASSKRLATQVGGGGGGTPGIVDPERGVTDVPPVQVGSSTIPQGGSLVRVQNPLGSDEPFLYYVVYQWRGVETAFEVGGPARFRELFGSEANFAAFQTITQAAFDNRGFVLAGSIDQELGATESFGSRVEREVRALGLEDLPSWLAGSPDALAMVAQATAQEWSSGRLWQQLSTTQAFQTRFGAALPRYLQQGVSIGDAVNRLVADEEALRTALRPFLAGTQATSTEYVQGLINAGWTPGAAAQVLEQAESLRRDPRTLMMSNLILTESGLSPLDEVGFINALNGVGPQETIEALNTATAARALTESGIDLDDDTIRLVMDLVDTSDRLLTAESWRGLAQELSFNLMRFGHELDTSKLGIGEDDLFAAAFGRESPTGKSAGEVIGALARFERDRRAAAQGFDQSQAFLDPRGRLRIQGLSGL